MDGEKAFRANVVALLPQLRRFALTLTRNRPDADDLVQIGCIKAIERHTQFRQEMRLDSWMYTILRNTWVSEIRKRNVRMGEGQVEAAEAPELRTDVDGHEETYGNQIIAMVMALPEGLSSVLLLVSVEGRSYKETAEILGIPIGTVMSRMSTARQRLRAQLEGGAN
ncbi:RNA polymerase sigma factor [Algicella marina]|uniref:Sigma-70 family RNA polymerase sigma factor n=1 Tax=Algicella marina TaxID=2683284 RepID=A0A6P1SZC1_9RHOB|nr:RNA polymerase sigma factor [Algicella marina]QHQ36034.1 sigma-70 family RNA polymerase sigma factor [Algicella marina]